MKALDESLLSDRHPESVTHSLKLVDLGLKGVNLTPAVEGSRRVVTDVSGTLRVTEWLDSVEADISVR